MNVKTGMFVSCTDSRTSRSDYYVDKAVAVVTMLREVLSLTCSLGAGSGLIWLDTHHVLAMCSKYSAYLWVSVCVVILLG